MKLLYVTIVALSAVATAQPQLAEREVEPVFQVASTSVDVGTAAGDLDGDGDIDLFVPAVGVLLDEGATSRPASRCRSPATPRWLCSISMATAISTSG